MPSIFLSKAKEAEIQACFNAEIEFHYAEDTEKLKELFKHLNLELKI